MSIPPEKSTKFPVSATLAWMLTVALFAGILAVLALISYFVYGISSVYFNGFAMGTIAMVLIGWALLIANLVYIYFSVNY
jgi:hypothetical protein